MSPESPRIFEFLGFACMAVGRQAGEIDFDIGCFLGRPILIALHWWHLLSTSAAKMAEEFFRACRPVHTCVHNMHRNVYAPKSIILVINTLVVCIFVRVDGVRPSYPMPCTDLNNKSASPSALQK